MDIIREVIKNNRYDIKRIDTLSREYSSDILWDKFTNTYTDDLLRGDTKGMLGIAYLRSLKVIKGNKTKVLSVYKFLIDKM